MKLITQKEKHYVPLFRFNFFVSMWTERVVWVQPLAASCPHPKPHQSSCH